MCGATVQEGAEWEPVLLTVVRPFLSEDAEQAVECTGTGAECEKSRGDLENGGPGLMREERGFAGGATLLEVREALGEPKESLLCQESKGGKGREQGEG